MLQNLNLLPESYIEKKIAYSGQQLLKVNLALLVLLLGLVAVQWISLNQLQKKDRLLITQVTSTQNQLDVFNAQNKKPQLDNKLQEQLTQIKKTLAENKQLNAQINHLLSDQQQGFAVFLEALAAQQVEGVWLNSIQIADDGKRLILHGGTLNAQQVPEYLEKLKQENIFAGRVFDEVSFDRDSKDPQIIYFALTIGKSTDKLSTN